MSLPGNLLFKKLIIMSTILIALGIIGFIALAVGFIIFVHKRDQKAQAAKERNLS